MRSSEMSGSKAAGRARLSHSHVRRYSFSSYDERPGAHPATRSPMSIIKKHLQRKQKPDVDANDNRQSLTINLFPIYSCVTTNVRQNWRDYVDSFPKIRLYSVAQSTAEAS